MYDYSHPRFYAIIGLVSILITLMLGIKMQQGFYFGMLGLAIFSPIYYWAMPQYDRTERRLAGEILLSFLGLIFLPLGYSLGFCDNIIPNTLDMLFFFVGLFSMLITTNLLYLIEPSDKQQLTATLVFAIFIQIIMMILIRIYTTGSYLGVS